MKQYRHILEVNLAILMISTSGPLGRALDLNPIQGIFWRAFFALFFLGGYVYFKKFPMRIEDTKDLKTIVFSGVLMGIHWVTYFFALQWSGVAIGMLSLFTYPVITAFLEPLLLKVAFDKKQIFLALLICVGIYLIAPNLEEGGTNYAGIAIGLFSAFCYALRNVILKRQASKYNGSVIMTYQMGITLILLFPSLLFFDIAKVPSQIPILLALALFTTTVGHTLFIKSFQYFSIATVSILSGMQPILGIIMAFLFLGEVPSMQTVVGGLIILSTVAIEGFFALKRT